MPGLPEAHDTAAPTRLGQLRLPGYGGAGLYLRAHRAPARRLGLTGRGWVFDVALLDPGRLVQYLSRPAAEDVLARLSRYLFDAASEFHPEVSLTTFADEGLGLTVSVVGSTELSAELQVTLVQDLDADVPEFEDLNFTTSRAALASAALSVRVLDDSLSPDVEPG